MGPFASEFAAASVSASTSQDSLAENIKLIGLKCLGTKDETELETERPGC